MIVQVKQSHINSGIKQSNVACPIALAIADKTGYTALVDRFSIRAGPIWMSTPESARAFISAFDKGYEVKPFDFELEVKREYTSNR